jgi:hypothetical protein
VSFFSQSERLQREEFDDDLKRTKESISSNETKIIFKKMFKVTWQQGDRIGIRESQG